MSLWCSTMSLRRCQQDRWSTYEARHNFLACLSDLIAQVREWLAEKWCVLILCRFPLEAQRMQDLLAEYDLGSRILSRTVECLSDTALHPGAILLSVGEVSQGFIFPEARLIVLREEDIFGEKKRTKPAGTAHRVACMLIWPPCNPVIVSCMLITVLVSTVA